MNSWSWLVRDSPEIESDINYPSAGYSIRAENTFLSFFLLEISLPRSILVIRRSRSTPAASPVSPELLLFTDATPLYSISRSGTLLHPATFSYHLPTTQPDRFVFRVKSPSLLPLCHRRVFLSFSWPGCFFHFDKRHDAKQTMERRLANWTSHEYSRS